MAGLTQSDVKDALEKAERELQELQSRASQLREWILATKKICSRRKVPPEETFGLFSMAPRQKRRRTKSTIADFALEILKETGRPLHVTELVAELDKKGHKVAVPTLTVALTRRPEEFVKVGPNKFDLVSNQVAKGA